MNSDDLVLGTAIFSLGAWYVLVEQVVFPPTCDSWQSSCMAAPFPALELLLACVLGAVFLAVASAGKFVWGRFA